MIKTGKILLLFYLVAFCRGQALSGSVSPNKNERMKLVHADSLIMMTVNGDEMTELWGNVRFKQGEAQLRCSHARWLKKKDSCDLVGNVLIYDGKRTLKADYVNYNGKQKTEEAVGHVILVDGYYRLAADTLLYSQEDGLASAFGRMSLHDDQEKATLFGEKGFYNRQLSYGKVLGNPRLVKIDTVSQEQMEVSGRIMEIWNGENRVLVTDSVRILKGEMMALCARAEYRYDLDRVILKDLPVLWYRDQEMKGDRITIQLEETRFEGGIIDGKAMIVSHDSTFQDLLQGNQITVIAEKDTVRQIIVDGQAISHYHVVDEEKGQQGVNRISGDQIILIFDGDKLGQVNVLSSPGVCEGVFIPSGIEEEPGTATSEELM